MDTGTYFEILGLAAGWVVTLFIAALGATVIKKMWTGEISLKGLIKEPEKEKASLSRFQFLIFTFVISSCLLWVTLRHEGFPEDIPAGIYVLLGISGGSYAISKQIQNQPASSTRHQPPEKPNE